MSTAVPKLTSILMKQVTFKIRSYSGMIWTLMVMQLLGSLMAGPSGGGGSIGSISYSFTSYNANSIIVLTMLWILVSSIIMTTKAYQRDDYTFVTTRKTSHFSNGLILLLASFFGALTAMLSSHVIRVIYLIRAEEGLITIASYSVMDWLVGFSVTLLYLILLGAVGYTIGMLFQIHVYFRVALVILVFSFFFLGGIINVGLIESLVQFYIMEPSFLLFTSKIIITTGMLFILTILITDRLEVRS
ncbi:hypothetical protein ACM26V_02335 [Salipaludibacillus sp. HK11]|uniref:hypothetical protein n=1 Tax=Salipaludibacillus sp. HK11 TaxID=3394320 RepID=UPI0039FC9618